MLIISGNVKRCGEESGRPIRVGGVIMRMGDNDGFELAQRANLRDRGIVDQGYHVPHDVAGGCADYESALAYRELHGMILA